MANLRVIARLVAFPDKVEELKELLLSLIVPTRAEVGCIQYDLLQNINDFTEFTFVEEWTTEEALDNHLASEHIQNGLRDLNGLVASGPSIIRCKQLG